MKTNKAGRRKGYQEEKECYLQKSGGGKADGVEARLCR